MTDNLFNTVHNVSIQLSQEVIDGSNKKHLDLKVFKAQDICSWLLGNLRPKKILVQVFAYLIMKVLCLIFTIFASALQ